MSRFTDLDGIDGPWEKAMNRAIREDAKISLDTGSSIAHSTHMATETGLDRSKYSGIEATPGTILLKVPAWNLKVGDFLVSTNRTVTSAPTFGVGTPSGKCDLGVGGFSVTWNRKTEILIERKGN